MSRAQLWAALEVPQHFTLVDDALDRNDADHARMVADAAEVIAGIRTEMKAGFERCEEDSDSLRRLLIGLLVAMVTTSITIVATVLIASGGG